MSAKIKVPDWVPYGVKSLFEVFELDNDNSRRMISDRRMKDVWKQLKSLTHCADLNIPIWFFRYHNMPEERRRSMQFFIHLYSFDLPEDTINRILSVDECCIANTYDGGDRELTVFDHLSAALFWSVTVEMSNPGRAYPAKTQVNADAKPYLDAANICKISRENDIHIRLNSELLDALERAEMYFRDSATMRKMENNPRVVPRGLGRTSDEHRGHYDMVSSIVDKLFGPFTSKFPKTAVARIVAVTLNTDVDAKEKVKALGKRRKRQTASRSSQT